MTTKVHMKCDGCDAEKTTEYARRTFTSFTGKSYGIGTYHYPTIDELVKPTGWTWSDPYTGCTYCPDCWKSIEDGVAA
jgi:hypothetical protein